MTLLDDIALHHLGSGIGQSFKVLAARCRTGAVDDPARSWVDLVAAALGGMRLTWPPVEEPRQPVLPFISPHHIVTEVYSVGGGGMLGGPTIDVLLQIWFETESMRTAFGVPLLLRCVSGHGMIARDAWDELRATARRLNEVTPCGRLVLIGNPDPFVWDTQYVSIRSDAYALSTIQAAGMIDPPRGMSGRILENFEHDLVSGWIGDPALAGSADSRELTDFLSLFDVAHLLRIRVCKDTA